jgi:hypothetical protein
MFSIEGDIAMSATAARRASIVLCLGALALSGCTQSTLRTSPDFGTAVRQDEAAQIADPDARYVGTPAPGSKGQRVGLAQTRYDTNQVIPPLDIGASNMASVNTSTNGQSAPSSSGTSMGSGGP